MLTNIYRSFVAEDCHIHIDKQSDRGYKLYADIVFGTEQFRQFQVNIIEEMLGQMQELIANENILFDDVIRNFENILQDTNEKLVLFSDKMTSIDSFDIRGIVTLSQHTNFVSAVLGNTSLVLVRKGHIRYSMQNDTDTRQRISLFSDIIEGDLHRDDVLFFFGVHTDALMDRDDMEHILQRVGGGTYEELLQNRVDDLGTRTALEEVGIVSQYYLNSDAVRSGSKKFSIPMPQGIRSLGERITQIGGVTLFRLQEKLKHRQFIVLLSIIGLFIIFILWSIIHGFIKNYSSATINSDGTTTATLSIEDIKKEIFVFQKLDPTSDEKAVKYNALLKELNIIQDQGKRANDVQQLKKILNTEYLQGFNIIMLDNVGEQMIYEFSSLETSLMQKPLGVFFYKGLYVAGTQGGILGAISTEIKGTTVRNAAKEEFSTCSLNLLKNGLYCATTKNEIYNVAKAGAEIVGGENITFPGSIVGLSTFGSSNFYVLSNDPAYTKDNSYISRYTNALGSQTLLQGSMNLPLLTSDTTYPAGFSSVAIDGTFLAWGKDSKSLIQMYRNPQDKALAVREVSLKGGTTLGAGFSDDVKVMTTPGTRYVYLYDRKTHTLSVYLSAPAKTTDTYSTTYSLDYIMRLDFSSMMDKPVDVTVDESDGKQTTYVLVSNGIAKIPMSDLLDTLNKTRATTE